MLIALRERRDVIVEDVEYATSAASIGTLPAAYALSAFPESAYELLFAVLVMLGVVLSAAGLARSADAAKRVPRRDRVRAS